MDEAIAGQVAFITGAGSGIGRQVALQLTRQGARCVLLDRDPEACAATVREAAAVGPPALACVADVRDEDAVGEAVARAGALGDGLAIAVNAAGVEGALAHTHEWTEEQWARTLEVNLTGMWRCLRHEIAAMLPAGRGRIVNVASIYGLRGLRGGAGYSASKHAVVGLTRSAALEYADRGLRINCVCPAPCDTPMMERLIASSARLGERVQQASPRHRLVPVSAVAEAICWLCLPASGALNGTALPVDDGWTAG